MSSPADLVILPRRRGRPRVREPRSSVSSWILARHHDLLVHLANERSVSVSAMVRSIIVREVKSRKPDPPTSA